MRFFYRNTEEDKQKYGWVPEMNCILSWTNQDIWTIAKWLEEMYPEHEARPVYSKWKDVNNGQIIVVFERGVEEFKKHKFGENLKQGGIYV